MEKVYNSTDFKSRIKVAAHFGEVKNGSQDVIKLFFPFLDPNDSMPVPTSELRSMVENHIINCDCTQPLYTDEGIYVDFNPSKARPTPQQFIDYSGRVPYETTITIVWKDGRQNQILNEKGMLVSYHAKSKVTLQVFGTIIE